MKGIVSLAVVAAVAGALLSGCAAKETKWSGETAAMVVYAKKVPLYPGAKAKDAMGSDTYGDTPESHFEGMTIWFELKGFDKEKVLAWYRERLPNAATETLDDGMIQLTVPVPGGEAGENMGVVVGDEDFRVFEHTKAGKHNKT